MLLTAVDFRAFSFIDIDSLVIRGSLDAIASDGVDAATTGAGDILPAAVAVFMPLIPPLFGNLSIAGDLRPAANLRLDTSNRRLLLTTH